MDWKKCYYHAMSVYKERTIIKNYDELSIIGGVPGKVLKTRK